MTASFSTLFAPHSVVIREIPREQWQQFFESFTMQHDAWLVRVDSTDGTLEEAPLEGITARDGEIVITTGRDSHLHRRVVVPAPRRVELNETGGVDYGLTIESDGGILTRLRFRRPVPPEFVDGALP